MKILFVHNYYQIAGGEDAVLKQEMDLLVDGHEVLKYSVSNDEISSFINKALTLVRVPFSLKSYRQFKYFLKINKPDVVHIHNYFPLLSPSIFYACKKMKIPVVHTLHNYRAVCPTAILMYQGKINERCIGQSSWWTVKEKAYKNSYLGSFALASLVQLHKKIGTWQTKVDYFIALTQFARFKYIEAGWPENKIMVKPNFMADPFNGIKNIEKKGGYALFVGRLSEEKGIDVLLDAWNHISLPLKLIGTGAFQETLEKNTQTNIEYLGLKDKNQVLELVRNASFIIMPSSWYEGFPMVLVEAFACGTPAVVSRLGSMEEIIEPGVTGLHFESGNPNDLAEKVNWMIDNPLKVSEMGCRARNEYLSKYTPEKNYKILMDIYQQAIDEATRTNG
jgi:glycosyltransferase involved in cell wall biosynthesis